MTQATYDQLSGLPSPEPGSAGAAGEWRMKRWQSALIALGSLVLVFGLAFGVMMGGGEIVRAVDPSRRINVFAAFHSWWVVGALLGITVLWLLPPHPWAKRAIASLPREHPAPGAGWAEVADGSTVTASLLDEHREPSPGHVGTVARTRTSGPRHAARQYP